MPKPSPKPSKPWRTAADAIEPGYEASGNYGPWDDVYWAVYNATVEEMHPHVPARYWHTKQGRAIRHAVARNAVQRLRDGEVHRRFPSGL